MSETNVDKPPCKLSKGNGSVFFIIPTVGRALKNAGLFDRAEEFYDRASAAKSYDEVIRLASEYVDVE